MKVLSVINKLNTGGAEKLILDTLPLINQQCHCDLYLLLSSNFPFENRLRAAIPHSILPTKWKSIYNPLHIISLMGLCKKYDIIHVHLFPSQYFVLIAKILSFSKIKIVVTEHTTTNNRMGNKFVKKIDQLSYTFFDKIICISKEIQGIMHQYTKLPLDKLPIIENGVSLQTIYDAKPIEKNCITDSAATDVIILQVAAFRHQKDQATLIKSLLQLPSNVKVWLAGSGVNLEKCKTLVSELNLKNRVTFLGVRSDIPQLLKTADMIVLSSHYEGLSLSSIEGMASGKPFIASDVPGLHEVVKNAGLLFEDKNDTQLAHHIQTLLADKAYYNEIAKACQERAKQFDIQKMVDKQVELYKNVCQ